MGGERTKRVKGNQICTYTVSCSKYHLSHGNLSPECGLSDVKGV